jgi:hypothetical protein
VGVTVAVGVSVPVGVTVAVGVTVPVGVAVGVTVGVAGTHAFDGPLKRMLASSFFFATEGGSSKRLVLVAESDGGQGPVFAFEGNGKIVLIGEDAQRARIRATRARERRIEVWILHELQDRFVLVGSVLVLELRDLSPFQHHTRCRSGKSARTTQTQLLSS